MKKRGRPRKVKDNCVAAPKTLKQTSASNFKTIFMSISPTGTNNGVETLEDSRKRNEKFETMNQQRSENKENCLSPANCSLSPRRIGGANKIACAPAPQNVITNHNNKAIKSLRPLRGRPPGKKNTFKGISSIRGKDGRAEGSESFPFHRDTDDLKKKTIMTNFRKPFKRVKISLERCDVASKKVNTVSNPEWPFLTCNTCSLECDSYMDLLKHDLSHFYASPLQCGLCQTRFRTFQDLSSHLVSLIPQDAQSKGEETVENLKPEMFRDLDSGQRLTCKECKTLFKHTKNLVVILKSHFINAHGCAFSNILNDYNIFSYTRLLTTNKETFTLREKVLCCPICFEEPITLKDVKKHLYNHIIFKALLRCDHCYVWFPSRDFLDKHLKCHENCLKLLETPCDKIKVVDMINQLPTSLLSRVQLQLSRTTEEDPCFINRMTKNELKRPMDLAKATSEDMSAHIPNQENSRLTNNLTLTSINTNDTFCRDVCKEVLQDSCREHSALHEKASHCSVCNSIFDSSLTLKRHKAAHRIPSPCRVCKKRFPSANLLKQHKKIHRKHITYDCKRCEKRFRSKTSYLFHISTHASRNNTSYLGTSSRDGLSTASRQEQKVRINDTSKGVCIRVTVQDAVLDTHSTSESEDAIEDLELSQEFQDFFTKEDV